MKNINECCKKNLIKEYLKTKIQNRSLLNNNLNKVYRDIYELVDDLNDYFAYDLKRPIKVIKEDIAFRPISPYSKDGIIVGEHFYITLQNNKKLRGGYREDYGLMLQKKYSGNFNSVGYITQYNGYKFKKDNFLEWLKGLKEKTYYKDIADMFGV